MQIIDFPGKETYSVTVGKGLMPYASEVIAKYEKVAVFVIPPLIPIANQLIKFLGSNVTTMVKVLPDGESSKTIEIASESWDFLAKNKLTRSDAIIAVGGGATTDLVNFVAATWLRGIDVFLFPSTVLSMVDAAIGGKCGINTGAGKNLVGVFNDPKAVYCDLDLLSTLDPRDLRAGFAEIIKCGFIADREILSIVTSCPEAALDPTSEQFIECVERAILVKANVVALDPFEKSISGVGRAALNYGHTLAHAIEKHSNYRWRHGDAVAVGMIFAAELAHSLGKLSQVDLEMHYDILGRLGLGTRYEGADLDELLPIMFQDKKSLGRNMRFVILNGIGMPEFELNPSFDTLKTAFARMTGENL